MCSERYVRGHFPGRSLTGDLTAPCVPFAAFWACCALRRSTATALPPDIFERMG